MRLRIEWIGDLPVKHPEFVARNRQTGEEVAVETKSRRRPGVLNQPGTVPPPENMGADVDRLYREALGQDMGNHPFAIFLDVNLPPSTASSAVAGWQREIAGRWGEMSSSRFSVSLILLGITVEPARPYTLNSSWQELRHRFAHWRVRRRLHSCAPR